MTYRKSRQRFISLNLIAMQLNSVYHNIAKFSIAFYSDFYMLQKIFVEILHILLYNRLKCF